MGKNHQIRGMIEGAVELDKHYLDKCQKMLDESGEYLIVRQEYESEMNGARKRMPKANEMLMRTGNALQEHRNKLNTNDNKDIREALVKKFYELLENYIYSNYHLGRNVGVAKENDIMLKKYDDMLRASGITVEEAVEITQPEGAVV